MPIRARPPALEATPHSGRRPCCDLAGLSRLNQLTDFLSAANIVCNSPLLNVRRGGEVLKVLTAPGVVLKGSGFYKTDSRSADNKRKSSGDHKPKDTDSKDSSTSTESGSSDQKSSDSGSGSTGDSTPSTTKSGESKSTAGAAKPS